MVEDLQPQSIRVQACHTGRWRGDLAVELVDSGIFLLCCRAHRITVDALS